MMLTPQTRTIETLRGRYDPVTDTGYMGYVSASDFITGAELIELLDFRDGTDQNSDAGWLKFYVGPRAACNQSGHQKLLLIAKKSLKHSVSWGQINNRQLVSGKRTLSINGQQYRVRLMTGGNTCPGVGSEWNELMYRVHAKQLEHQSNWETFDPAVDTNITGGDGRFVWCQETPLSKPTKHVDCVLRGGYGLAGWNTSASFISPSYFRWRPVLEWIGLSTQEPLLSGWPRSERGGLRTVGIRTLTEHILVYYTHDGQSSPSYNQSRRVRC